MREMSASNMLLSTIVTVPQTKFTLKCLLNSLLYFIGLLVTINERQYLVWFIFINPLGPRILLKHAPLFPGFLANFDRFYLLCSKICRKNYSILTITSCVYFEE